MTKKLFPNEFYINLSIENSTNQELLLMGLQISKVNRVW